ncbi:MAG: YigZ family protein [Bacteroidales bacterium]|nr:YigZ family protein [Bacteroidales bacterium]
MDSFGADITGNDTYRTIKGTSEGLYKEKGSKFIAFAFPVSSDNEVKFRLEELRKKYHDARHHAYAYRIGIENPTWRMNDDGEPSNTAGKPIYGQILSLDLTDILIVVIRYFGGVKLGVGGLIGAYKTAAHDALDKAEIITKTIHDVFEIHFQYEQMKEVMKILREENLKQITQSFSMDCKIILEIRKQKSDNIVNKFTKIKNLKIKHLQTA